MISVIVDATAIIAGGSAGLALKGKLDQKSSGTVMAAIGIYIMYLGITSFDSSCNGVVLLISLGLGSVIGSALDIEGKSSGLVRRIQRRIARGSDGGDISKSLVDFFLVSCTGAYVFLAAFETASGSGSMFYAKAVIDLIVSFMFASSMGLGIIFAAVPVFIYQALLVLFAGAISQVMSSEMLAVLTCTGGLVTIPIGTNMMGCSDIQVADMIPALIIAPLLQWILPIIN